MAIGRTDLRAGPEWIALNPFTPQERWVLRDSPEAQEWERNYVIENPRENWIVSHIDVEKGVIPFVSKVGEAGGVG